MPNTPITSFIPKQGPAKRSRQTATRQVHLLMVLSYVLFVAALIVSAGVFFYQKYVEKQLSVEVEKLSLEINGFSDADMERVREFNNRLEQTKDRLSKAVSLSSVFAALEESTVKSATIEELALKRVDDTAIVLAAKIATDNFDSTLFQRGLFERNDIIESVEVTEVEVIKKGEEGSTTEGVEFTATLNVPVGAVPITVDNMVVAEPVSETASSTSTSTESTIINSETP